MLCASLTIVSPQKLQCCLLHLHFTFPATGSMTTWYNVEDHGDPNLTLETTERERQYLIKWQKWAHIHNTWESDKTLVDQKVNGMKKLDLFKKREDELNEW